MTKVWPSGKGRYIGDLTALLEFNPTAGNRKYRVSVLEWRQSIWAEGGVGWRKPHPAIGIGARDYRTRDFLALRGAVRYLSDVEHSANLGYYSRQKRDRVESGWRAL